MEDKHQQYTELKGV